MFPRSEPTYSRPVPRMHAITTAARQRMRLHPAIRCIDLTSSIPYMVTRQLLSLLPKSALHRSYIPSTLPSTPYCCAPVSIHIRDRDPCCQVALPTQSPALVGVHCRPDSGDIGLAGTGATNSGLGLAYKSVLATSLASDVVPGVEGSASSAEDMLSDLEKPPGVCGVLGNDTVGVDGTDGGSGVEGGAQRGLEVSELSCLGTRTGDVRVRACAPLAALQCQCTASLPVAYLAGMSLPSTNPSGGILL